MSSRNDDGSARIEQASTPSTGTRAGEDVTSRMTGVGAGQPVRDRDVRDTTGRELGDNGSHDHDHDHEVAGQRDRTQPSLREERVVPREVAETGPSHLKTSAAAAFALVFGVAALFSALTAILAPVAVVLGIIGIILAVAGMKMAKRPGITGRGVARGGLVTSILAVLLGIAVLVGASVLINNDSFLNKISNKVDDLKSSAPSGDEIKNSVPGQ